MAEEKLKAANIPAATGDDANAAAKRITRAVNNLYMTQAFFASLLSQMPRIPTRALPSKTMATDGISIFYDVDFVNDFKHTQGHLEYGLCHEVGHRMNKHFTRKGSRDPRLWNIAGDHSINVLQDRMGVGEPIPNLYRDEQLYDAAGGVAETIYRLMEEDPDKYPPQSGGGFDDHIEPDLTEEEAHIEEQRVTQQIASAAITAKIAGQLPEALEKMIHDLLYPAIPWQRIAEDWVQARAKIDRTYAKPNRRWMGSSEKIIRPSLSGHRLAHLALGIDCSGSVGDAAQMEFGGCMAEIKAALDPELMTVVYFTSEVTHVDEFEAGEDLPVYVRHGSGGTRVRPVFNHLEQLDVEPDGLIMLTDMGIGDYPEYEPGYPVLWVNCDNDRLEAPFGRTINMNMSN